MIDDSWRLIGESGGDAVVFSSMLEFSVSAGGQALSAPLEKGSFATYNKIQSPLDINLELAVDGDAYTQSAAIARLEEMRQGLEKVTLSTPYEYYRGLTLDSFTHRRGPGLENHSLVARLHLVEVREVGDLPGGAISSPKNVSSQSRLDLGKTQIWSLATDAAVKLAESRLPEALRRILD